MSKRTFAAVLALLIFASACSSPRVAPRGAAPVSRLPPVPTVNGALRLQLAYPPDGALRPDADSTFLFGSTGTGQATLSINGQPVAVAANGAFLAYVPVRRAYLLEARARQERDTLVYFYRVPAAPAPAVETFAARTALVASGRDTLATGSQIADAAPSPEADRRWFLPIGTRLVLDGKLAGADVYRARLTPTTEAWIRGSFLAFVDSAATLPPAAQGRIVETGAFTDVIIASHHAPFLIDAGPDEVRVTVYGPAGVPPFTPTAFLAAIEAHARPDSTVLVVRPTTSVWGFKAFYTSDGSLVVRLRHPPHIDPASPARGVRIVVDPGHPPAGAIGPTGLTEAEANLQIGLRLAQKLRARGADVRMTRTGPDGMVSNTSAATDLWARVDSAVAWDAELLVSVHNNAFADGVNPFTHVGSETYYFHPFSRPLAEALLAEIVPVTGLSDLGAKPRSLALTRPTWMPSVLTESLFMMFPQQEAALRDPAFLDRLAEAHLRGIEAFLRRHARP